MYFNYPNENRKLVQALSPLALYYRMVLVNFQTPANQNHWIWSHDEFCNPRLRGYELIVGFSLMSRKMDAWSNFENIFQGETKKKSIAKRSATKSMLLINLVFTVNTWGLFDIMVLCTGMELECYLKSSTGKSYSNIKITQGPYVNECMTVTNM